MVQSVVVGIRARIKSRPSVPYTRSWVNLDSYQLDAVAKLQQPEALQGGYLVQLARVLIQHPAGADHIMQSTPPIRI